ncbi:hypothetical protein [Rhizobium sp. BE258]|uniref:hypothetical protein n=1 Tax=Rhizobium sp. BE258 TaxID=2817722 RepID=UPI002857A7EF|nr:hypothetical protein [Rhizobium sp. BE258]MDR7145559.1 hypothetical protein [Rhizobium sp. BE258]
MKSFTLDTNCLIDIDEDRPAAAHIRALLEAGASGKADLALVASSASERQKGGTFLANISEFKERQNSLGFGSLPLLPSIARADMSFFDKSLYGWSEGTAREGLIFNLLFPSSSFEWADYAAAKGVDSKDHGTGAYLRWRNMILDAQALWAHDHAGRAVFVTSDVRLKIINDHPEFPAMNVRTPEEAADLL